MKIENARFKVTDWEKVSPRQYPGEVGFALSRTVEEGNARVRIVEYSPGYEADHWCEKGHIVFVLEGELITKLRDGRTFVLKAGMSYSVAEGSDEAHRSSTSKGAKLFIVD